MTQDELLKDNIILLNVKTPFCEAVECLMDEVNYVGMMNIATNVVVFVDNGELFVKKGTRTVRLTVSDVMDADWYLMCRQKNTRKETADE